MLCWSAPKAKTEMDVATRYVVYRFVKGERIDLEDPTHIVAITTDNMMALPYQGGCSQFTYVVTALDRLQNESKGVKKKVRL